MITGSRIKPEDGLFRLTHAFPKEGSYRLLTDFYPTGASPQMRPVTVTTAGFEQSLGETPSLALDLEPKKGENLEISLRTEPTQPLATLIV